MNDLGLIADRRRGQADRAADIADIGVHCGGADRGVHLAGCDRHVRRVAVGFEAVGDAGGLHRDIALHARGRQVDGRSRIGGVSLDKIAVVPPSVDFVRVAKRLTVECEIR